RAIGPGRPATGPTAVRRTGAYGSSFLPSVMERQGPAGAGGSNAQDSHRTLAWPATGCHSNCLTITLPGDFPRSIRALSRPMRLQATPAPAAPAGSDVRQRGLVRAPALFPIARAGRVVRTTPVATARVRNPVPPTARSVL